MIMMTAALMMTKERRNSRRDEPEVNLGGISICAGEDFHIFHKQYLLELEVADLINPGSRDIREADTKWVLGKKLGVTVSETPH